VIKIYTAANPTEAHLLRGALEAAGIDALVRGEFLFGTRGESPITTDTLPSVWLVNDDDLDPARAIVREFDRRAPPGPVDTWICQCGETNEAPFDACWRCGTARP
jgi:hypothetical protein